LECDAPTKRVLAPEQEAEQSALAQCT